MLDKLTDFPALDRGPLEPLDIEGSSSHRRKENDSLETDLLPVVVFRFCGPVQEGCDILGHL